MHDIITTIAAVLLVGGATPQQPEPPTSNAPDISIHHAVATGDIEAVKRHLNAGTDVNEKEKNATINWRKGTSEIVFTPLHYAAMYGRLGIVQMLIAKGVDVNANFFDSGTPLDAVELFYHQQKAVVGLPVQLRRPFKEIIDLLRKHGAKTAEELKAEGK